VKKFCEVTRVPEPDYYNKPSPEFMEEGVEVPFARLDPETLRNLIAEFVTREWEDSSDSSSTLDNKISQVMRQLNEKRARVVFDLRSETCNIVVRERG
jgi:uncharacterized protein YheU (UPF0270 family)